MPIGGPSIVTSNLKFYIDPANPRTWDGANVTIFNLVRGSTFGNANVTISSPTLLSNNCTVSIWFKYSNVGATSIGPMIGFQGGGTDFEITKPNGANYIAVSDNQYISSMFITQNVYDGNWHQITYGFGTGKGTIWVDGLWGSTNTFTGAASSTRVIIGGELYAASASHFIGGQFGPIKVYDKLLSNVEVAQNFHAIRGRYGV
jgi:hypothetical protein